MNVLSEAARSDRDRAVQHGHIGALDGLRGVAALAVVFNHLSPTFAALAGSDMAAVSIWSILDHLGHNAVILFFCLSGFVLQRAYEKGRDRHYGRYLIRRAFRLLPVLYVVVLAVCVLLLFVRPPGGLVLLNNDIDTQLSIGILLKHLTLTGLSRIDVGLDPPMWSLVYEWRFSLVFPLMALLCRPAPIRFLVGCLGLYGMALLLCHSRGLGWPYFYGFGRIGSLYITLLFLPLFGLGMALSTLTLRSRPRRIAPPAEAVILVVSLAIFGLARDQLLVSAAAVATMIVILYGTLARSALETPLSQWLGRLSYPLYLSHLPVLYFTFLLLQPIGPLGASLIGIAASLLIAAILHVTVETRANDFGRALALRLRPA
jgi:peptidoglycan/LPS O-acetylase OafA/YrhL